MLTRASFLAVVCLLAACKKEPPAEPTPKPVELRPSAPTPTEVSLDGAYHAVRCGDVTATWSGSADDLKELPTEGAPVPKRFGVKGLTFVFTDGTAHPFTPSGELAFSDWSFDIFSPDCSRVALLQDRFGPYTVLATKDLKAFANPTPVRAEGAEAAVHGQWRWTGPSTFEFVASAGGGARVLSGEVTKPAALTMVFEAPSAPAGVRPTAAGWEVAK